eukprot:GHUV01032063.1.p1 GENE.GHUV01032063.1~~GHUV01032063.1.p1  ORF type:complete len:232 (-),score=35.40 GHUV01032063.1:710-1405(-)
MATPNSRSKEDAVIEEYFSQGLVGRARNLPAAITVSCKGVRALSRQFSALLLWRVTPGSSHPRFPQELVFRAPTARYRRSRECLNVVDIQLRQVRSLLFHFVLVAATADNPYYYLASALGAYVDENVLWNEPDILLVSNFDNEGGLEVADPVTKLCKLASNGTVWGLPHVLRCISQEGVKVVHDVLSNSMTDSFFPGPMPFSNKDGYTLQILASVQVTPTRNGGVHGMEAA